MDFLSERNIEMHKEYMNTLCLRYSMFEKSYPELSGCNAKDVQRLKIRKSERDAAQELLCEIEAHKIFFSSFGKRNSKSERICREFGSEAALLYKVFCECEKVNSGFLLIYEEYGKIKLFCGNDYKRIICEKNVFLSVDLCEHAYFFDYFFDKKAYLAGAISHLDLRKL